MRLDPVETARRVAGNEYEVLGEMGREGDSAVAFLARENDTGQLVALTLEGLAEATALGVKPGFSVRRVLDPSIPAVTSTCPHCKAAVSTWARFCPACERDLAGTIDDSDSDTKSRAAAAAAAEGRFALLGEMNRAEGGAPVYFAQEQDTGRIVALRIDTATATGTRKAPTASVTQRLAALSTGGSPSPPRPAAANAPGITPAEAVLAAPEPGAKVYVCPTCETVYAAGIFFCPRDGTALKLKTQGHDLAGRTIAGRYRILERLGQGGMGQVYKAEHVRMGSHCAIKIMNPALESDPEALGRFAREAAHASRISHANIARVYDFGETQDGLLFIAMEFAEGKSLSAIIAREGALQPVRAAEIGRQVADALVAAHELGTIHRDIKPDNIIVNVSPSGREAVKVVDFGIAKGINVGEGEQVTRAGFVVGNPKYMSPEQLIGETVDARGDIYGLGCVLYEMLVGEAAFAGTTGAALLTRRLTEPAPSPRRKLITVPPELDAIVTRALARERDSRFASALDMRDALAEYIEASGARRATTRRKAVKELPVEQPVEQPAERPPEKKTWREKKATAKQEAPPEPAAPEPVTPPEPAAPEPARAAGGARRLTPRPWWGAVAAAAVIALVAVIWSVRPPGPAPEPRPGTVEILGVMPDGAAVTARNAQGQSIPVTGASIALPAGTWQLLFEAPGHETDRAQITVEEGGRLTWAPRVMPVPRQPETGVIRVAGDLPAGAAVTARNARGVELALAGGPVELEPGTWRLAFSAPGFEPDERTIVIAAGGTETWTPRLRRVAVPVLTGTVRIAGDLPPGAAISARGPGGTARPVSGRTITLDAGTWTFEARAPGYTSDQASLQVRAGETQSWTPQLRALREQPSLSPASVDSVRALLGAAQAAAGRKEYPDAFRAFRQAAARIAALLGTFPGAAPLAELDRQIRAEEATVLSQCEAWRSVQVELGRNPPPCR